jgi:hypothetical protein
MTKDDVLNFLESCETSGEKPFGYMIVAISREDIVSKFGDSVRKFDLLNKEQKENVLSELADDMNDVYENEHFGDDFRKVFGEFLLGDEK